MADDTLPTLYTQPGSRWWYYSWYHAGRRERRSCKDFGLHTGIPLEQAMHRLCIELALIPADPPPDAVTLVWFRTAVLHRLDRAHARPGTVKEYRIALNHLTACFGEDYPLRDFRRADVGRLQDYLAALGQQPPTTNKICRHLRGAFSRLVDEELLDRNPFRKFRTIEENGRKKNLTRAETLRFLEVLAAHPDEAIRRLIRIYLFTGRRRGEILFLPRRNIDTTAWTLRVANNKARRLDEQVIRIHPGIRRSVAWFLQQPRRSASAPVPPEPGRPLRDYPFCVCREDYITRVVKRLLRSSGLGALHLHSLRHTFGTLARESGVSREDLQAHYGHSDIATTEIYDHYTPLPEISLGLEFGADNDT